MMITVRKYNNQSDLKEMVEIWNGIVREGIAFPQEEILNQTTGAEFFAGQTYSGVAVNTDGGTGIDRHTGTIAGLYILHPNNVGRCGHICNASYAVSPAYRGKHIGKALVLDSLRQAKNFGFRIMQFNAVVESNPARYLYEKLGFIKLGVIPGGFRMKDGHYENICPYYYDLYNNTAFENRDE